MSSHIRIELFPHRIVQASLAVLLVFSAGCHPNEEQRLPKAGTTAPARLFTHRVVPNGKTFGYEVHFDGKPVIRQMTVPGRPGKVGFKDSMAAEKAARLIEAKMANGIEPAALSQQELDSIGVATK